MSRGISLAPCGLVIEQVEAGTDKLLLITRPISKTSACPTCRGISARIHSQLGADLHAPAEEQKVCQSESVACTCSYRAIPQHS